MEHASKNCQVGSTKRKLHRVTNRARAVGSIHQGRAIYRVPSQGKCTLSFRLPIPYVLNPVVSVVHYKSLLRKNGVGQRSDRDQVIAAFIVIGGDRNSIDVLNERRSLIDL